MLKADTAEEIFRKAALALQSQDYAAAETGFQSVLKLEPRNIGALGNLGVIYSRTHRYTGAIKVYRRALDIVPGEKTLLTNLGLAYIKQEQFDAARPIFEILVRDAGNLQAQELLASCYLSLGSYTQALSILAHLEAAEPANPGVLYMSGVALTRLRRKEEAHDRFVRMMSAVTPAQASFLMGKASYETGDFESAVDFFRKALAADPSLKDVHRELGKTLVSLHQDDAATAELRLADPEDPEATYFLGAALSTSQPEEASPLLSRARELNPGFWGPSYYLGRIAVEQHRPKDAIPLLERAAKLKPKESAIHYQLARAFQMAGRQEEAKAEFARVKELKQDSQRSEGSHNPE